MEFENQVALVTGAAGAIGKGIAARLLGEGARVFITDLDQSRLDAVCAELGPNCRGLAADVTVEDQVRQVVQAALAAFGGRIDVLVNVAGTVGKGGPVEEMSLDNWEFVFAVNCRGTFLFTKEVVPAMKRAGRGSIVNFSSKSGKTGSALIERLLGGQSGHDWIHPGHGVRIGSRHPRQLRVSGNHGRHGRVEQRLGRLCAEPQAAHAEVVKKFTSKVPLGRLARIDDVVNMTCFLASARADYMTGQAINITGGREMH